MVDDLLQRGRGAGTPLIDGDTATFVWEGAEAPRLVGDFNGWGARSPGIELDLVAPGVWAHTMKLAPDAYLEYMYLRGEERILDPLNPHARYFWVPEGDFNNWFAMPEFTETPLIEDRAGVPKGTITHHEVDGGVRVFGNKRPVHLYRPPVDQACRLLVVLDGHWQLERFRLRQTVDNLISEKRIEPLAMALVHCPEDGRMVEYNCSDATLAFLVDSVLPLAHENLNLVDGTGVHGILGASLGGTMALYAALRAPHHFGCAVIESAWLPSEGESVLWELVRHRLESPPRIWMDKGRYESGTEGSQHMHELLQRCGCQVSYHQFNGGHNTTSIRNDAWRGLEALFPAA